MKILLDCRFQKGAGPNVTARYMIDHLVKLNTKHEFVILQHQGQPIPDYSGIKKIMVPSRNRLVEFSWVQTKLPRLLKQNTIDLCHSLKHVGPLYTSIPTILHLREVGHFFPEGQKAFKLNLPNKIYWNHILVWGLKRATHIIGVSYDCKKVITQKFGIPEDKVSVVYQGLDSKFKVIPDSEIIAKRLCHYNLPKKYILCVGNLYPHKNYETVVKMFAKLLDCHKEPVKLVFVGDASYAGHEFFELIQRLGIEKHITFTKYLEHDDLVYVYNGASLFLFPPIVASFPNPCLEAMACGIPVVASNRGAVAEVTGGAALLFENPRDEKEMLAAVRRALEEPKLRREMQQKGFQRVQGFSWEASATKVLSIYEAIGKRYELIKKCGT